MRKGDGSEQDPGGEGLAPSARSDTRAGLTATELAILVTFTRPFVAGERFASPPANNKILEDLGQAGLYMDLDTLRTHVRNLYAKLGVEDGLTPAEKRVRLVELVYENGVISGWGAQDTAVRDPPPPSSSTTISSIETSSFPAYRKASSTSRSLSDIGVPETTRVKLVLLALAAAGLGVAVIGSRLNDFALLVVALSALPLLLRVASRLLEAFLVLRAETVHFIIARKNYSLGAGRPDAVEDWVAAMSAEIDRDAQRRHDRTDG
jgi:hypothetical protein